MERGDQKVMQSLKLTWINLLSLHSCLVVARVALKAGRVLNTHPIYCDIDKAIVAHECE